MKNYFFVDFFVLLVWYWWLFFVSWFRRRTYSGQLHKQQIWHEIEHNKALHYFKQFSMINLVVVKINLRSKKIWHLKHTNVSTYKYRKKNKKKMIFQKKNFFFIKKLKNFFFVNLGTWGAFNLKIKKNSKNFFFQKKHFFFEKFLIIFFECVGSLWWQELEYFLEIW